MTDRNALHDNSASEDSQGEISLEGTLLSIVYANDANAYMVGRFEVEAELFPIVATGEMFSPSIGDSYQLYGEWVQHPKYGRQFKWESYDVIYPATRLGMEKYLASGLIRGIGKTTAHRIVNRFGLETIEIMNTDINRLTEVEGIGEKKLALIQESWEEQRGVQKVMLFLKSHDISTGFAVRIFRTYGAEAITMMNQNPYRMIEDVEGVGFVIADKIARRLGRALSDPARVTAGLLYVLNEAARSAGHVYLPYQQCLHTAASILETSEEDISTALRTAAASGLMILEDDNVYLPDLRYAERSIVESIRRLFDQEPRKVDHLALDVVIERIEKSLKLSFTPIQIEVIHKAVVGPVLIMTGGPGTGKTTTVAGILAVAEELELETVLCAPTGRAAKRLAEVTNSEAKTIHRLLEFDPMGGFFRRTIHEPLESDLIIVDEVSMVDVQLMAALLVAIPDGARVVFVGDSDQLPSVGPGDVLRDMIESKELETISLHTIFRQAESSSIITNSHRMREGFLPVFGKETFFMEADHGETIARIIREVVVERIPREMNYNAMHDIQVLSPMHNTAAGVRHLNTILQKDLNGTGRVFYQKGEKMWRLGDKVMQTKNNYEKDVYNGDIGFILSADQEEGEVTISFDNRPIVYKYEELDDLVLAYAITIHKSQGSEYNVVVVPVTMQHRIMLQRNLVYTAMTRAKELLVFVGQRSALQYAVHNETISTRFSSLKNALNHGLRR